MMAVLLVVLLAWQVLAVPEYLMTWTPGAMGGTYRLLATDYSVALFRSSGSSNSGSANNFPDTFLPFMEVSLRSSVANMERIHLEEMLLAASVLDPRDCLSFSEAMYFTKAASARPRLTALVPSCGKSKHCYALLTRFETMEQIRFSCMLGGGEWTKPRLRKLREVLGGDCGAPTAPSDEQYLARGQDVVAMDVAGASTINHWLRAKAVDVGQDPDSGQPDPQLMDLWTRLRHAYWQTCRSPVTGGVTTRKHKTLQEPA